MSSKLYNGKKGLTIMSFIEIAKKRYSVRNYSDRKVEKEKLEKYTFKETYVYTPEMFEKCFVKRFEY